jgi:rhodanese-related sulfurtransferase
MADDPRCSPEELAKMLERGDDFCLLDVRTAEEVDCARIDGATHIPLNELPHRLDELEPWRGKIVVAMCHHGMRSEMAQEFLNSHGFDRVRNLSGGIDAYSAQVNPAIRRY